MYVANWPCIYIYICAAIAHISKWQLSLAWEIMQGRGIHTYTYLQDIWKAHVLLTRRRTDRSGGLYMSEARIDGIGRFV
jgi:hypothetical protein